jgi:hypothetical protein
MASGKNRLHTKEIKAHGTQVGSNYSEDRRVVPWNAGIDHGFYEGKFQSVISPAESTFDAPFSAVHNYNKLWEGD